MALGSKNATIHALLHTLIEAGQPCWLSLEGRKADGTAHNLALWDGLPDQVNDTWISQGFWPVELANSYLKQLGHGTTLTIKFEVSMDKSNNPATATVFPDRTYTIKAIELEAPTITSVRGNSDSGPEIPNGTSTTATTLVFTGNASANQRIELRDKGVVKYTITVGATGYWSHTLTGLAQGDHIYTAKATYGTLPESAAWRLTVIAEVAPTISSVKDSKGEIPHGGSTVDSRITLTGTASKGQKVKVLDGGTDMGEAIADLVTGIWTLVVSVLSLGGHIYSARARYGTEPVSNARNLVRYAPLRSPTITGVYANGVRIPPGGSLTTPATIHFTGTCSPGPQGYTYFRFNGVRDTAWAVNISTNGTVWTSSSVFVQFFSGGQSIPQTVSLLDDRMGGNLLSPTYTFTPKYTP
ncbi:Ig-like domain-containing protein [Pseudomonas sp. LB1P83]